MEGQGGWASRRPGHWKGLCHLMYSEDLACLHSTYSYKLIITIVIHDNNNIKCIIIGIQQGAVPGWGLGM